MKAKSLFTIALGAAVLAVSSCSNYNSLDTYSANSIGSTQATYTGTITGIENVKIQTNANTGTALGAVAGGLAGSMLGKGKGRYGNAAGGAVLGAIIGNQVDKGINDSIGNRVTVRLDQSYQGSRTFTIVQPKAKNAPLYVGQQVRVIMGSSGSRVLPY